MMQVEKQIQTEVIKEKDNKVDRYLLGSFIAPVYQTNQDYDCQPKTGHKFKIVSYQETKEQQERSGISRYQMQVGCIHQDYTGQKRFFVLKNGKIYKLVSLGYLFHCYSDIWKHLAQYQLIHMKVDQVLHHTQDDLKDRNVEQQFKRVAFHLKINVFLSERAFQSYPRLQKNIKIKNKVQKFQNDGILRDSQVITSLQVLFDFFMIEKSIPSTISYDKQWKSYFRQQYYKYDIGTIGDVAKIIVDFNQNKKSIMNNHPLYTEESFNHILVQEPTQDQNIIIYEQQLTFNPQYVKLTTQLINEFKEEVYQLSEEITQKQKKKFILSCCEKLLQREQQLDQYNVNFDRLNSLCCKIKKFIEGGSETIQCFDLGKQRLLKKVNLIEVLNNKLSEEQANLWLKNLTDEIAMNPHKKIQLNELSDIFDTDEDKNWKKSTTPITMKTQLMPHQQQALTWMLYREKRINSLHENLQQNDQNRKLSEIWQEYKLPKGQLIYHNNQTGKIHHNFQELKWTYGGIIADEMGLGKTIMALALIHQTKYEKGQTLVVVPKSVINQWKNEIIKHSSDVSVKVLVYYDRKDRSVQINLNNYDIIITTYNILAQDYKYITQYHRKQKIDKGFKLNCLLKHNFMRIILDEAHQIKNEQSISALASVELQATYRWCLTGTPFHNKYEDIFSLLKFLKVPNFGERFWWNNNIQYYGNSTDTIILLKQILKPVVLRRKKSSTGMEQNIITQIDEQIIWITLSEDERILYDQLKSGTQSLFELVEQQKGGDYIHIFQIMLKLRQACCHMMVALKGIDLGDDIKLTIHRIENFFIKQAKNIRGLKQSEDYRKDQIARIRNGELTNCQICMNEDVQFFQVSICAHVFCEGCFSEAVRQQGKCPQCRLKLTYADLMKCQTVLNEQAISVVNKESSKLLKVVDEALKVKQQGQKVLIFTQWIGVIEILQKMFNQRNLVFKSITGSLALDKRTMIIDEFQNCKDTTALILSIMASSTGLNLTMANHVYIVDPMVECNIILINQPAIEKQAIGRVHRIGQNQQVFVKRFLCKETIEEKIHILHHSKDKIIYKEEIQFLLY